MKPSISFTLWSSLCFILVSQHSCNDVFLLYSTVAAVWGLIDLTLTYAALATNRCYCLPSDQNVVNPKQNAQGQYSGVHAQEAWSAFQKAATLINPEYTCRASNVAKKMNRSDTVYNIGTSSLIRHLVWWQQWWNGRVTTKIKKVLRAIRLILNSSQKAKRRQSQGI